MGLPDLLGRLEQAGASNRHLSVIPLQIPPPRLKMDRRRMQTTPALPKEPLPTAPVLAASGMDAVVKIATERLDALINLVGELVVAELMVRDAVSAVHGARPHGGNDSSETSAAESIAPRRLADLGRITRELYDLSVSMRTVPIHSTFQKMVRAVRDLGRKTGKELELRVRGGETELDRKLVEAIADPLMHMVRNAVDHGIEPPGDRVAAGKKLRRGSDLRARHEGGEIVIEVSDDGRGLDRERIVRKAEEAGITPPHQVLSDEEAWRLIFHPGLSTAAQVTDVSGRGVGMDVVKRNVETLRGGIEIRSSPVAGTAFRVRLPLTLAVIDALTVGVGAART